MSNIPTDILIYILNILDTKDMLSFRAAVKIDMNPQKFLFDISVKYLKKHPPYVNKRLMCVHCKHDCISEITWINRLYRKSIPWCVLHVSPPIMDNIEFYCLGCKLIDN